MTKAVKEGDAGNVRSRVALPATLQWASHQARIFSLEKGRSLFGISHSFRPCGEGPSKQIRFREACSCDLHEQLGIHGNGRSIGAKG